MAERQAREARALQAKALERLRTLRPEELGPADVLRYFVDAVARSEAIRWIGCTEAVLRQFRGSSVPG